MRSKRVSIWGMHRKKGLGLFGGKHQNIRNLSLDGAIPGLYIERRNSNTAYSRSRPIERQLS